MPHLTCSYSLMRDIFTKCFRYGRFPIILAGTLLSTIVVVITSISSTLWLILSMRFLLGFLGQVSYTASVVIGEYILINPQCEMDHICSREIYL